MIIKIKIQVVFMGALLDWYAQSVVTKETHTHTYIHVLRLVLIILRRTRVCSCFVFITKHNGFIDITFQTMAGLKFMGVLGSFLVVARANFSHSRFMEVRHYLFTCFRTCREIVQSAAVHAMINQDSGAKQWRQDVAYRTILLLRVTVAVLEKSVNSSDLEGSRWDVIEQEPVQSTLENEVDTSAHLKQLIKLAHTSNNEMQRSFRAPVILAYNLRETMTIQRNGQFLKERMAVNDERDLLIFVSNVVRDFHGFRVLTFTPCPSHLIQVTLTCFFQFFWVYSLPLVLVGTMESLWQNLLLIFFTTFGFLGIEYVAMALEDPLADEVYEDIYFTLYKVDGAESAVALRSKIDQRCAQDDALNNYRNDIRQDDFWAKKGKKLVYVLALRHCRKALSRPT